MEQQGTEYAVRHVPNAQATPGSAYGAAQRRVLNREAFERARAVITAWPGYAPTPLVDLPGLAARLGVGRVALKDESQRLGLGSFKALGGAYAVFRLLADAVQRETGTAPTAGDLTGGAFRSLTAGFTVTCASAGNHGKAVAWGAACFGCRCVVYVAENVSTARADAIARYGARVARAAGTYDEAVRLADREAARHGWHVISDTSYPGYLETPRTVMQGYTVMADETVDQWAQPEPPTHAFVQCGVGGLAAAVCAHFWETWRADRPRFVVVEPVDAACMLASAEAGRPTTLGGNLETMMTCLACGEASLLAWDLLRHGADHFLAVPDAAEQEALYLLGRGTGTDPSLHLGPSGAAGLAGLLAATRSAHLRQALALDVRSRVLLIGSEAATP